jgi:hypothetical protein
MGKILPTEIDDIFLVDVILIFLMINYNLPLATIYSMMVLLGAAMYLVPVYSGFFRWIPIAKPGGNKLISILIGVGFGWAFVYVYDLMTKTAMKSVFATTIFGESEILTNLIYSGLVPVVETLFFFRIILQWWAWKHGDSVRSSPFSMSGLKLMLLFGAIFTVFHATAKGISNTVDLAATLLFGMMSVGMVMYFGEMLPAIAAHIYVNSNAMGLFGTLEGLWQASIQNTSWVVVAMIAGGIYLMTRKKGSRMPLLS